VVKLLYCLLDFTLDALNFLCLVLVLNTLISYFLLLLEYFLIDWFLVLFPLVMEVLKFLFDHGDLILQHTKVLSTKLLQFLKYFLLLFCLLLESLECLPKVFLLLGSFLFSSSAFLVVEAQSIGFSFDCINLSNKALDLLLLLNFQLVDVKLLPLHCDEICLLLALLVLPLVSRGCFLRFIRTHLGLFDRLV
jgi:hypothetical protein